MYLILNSWLKFIFLEDILAMLLCVYVYIYIYNTFETFFAPIHDTTTTQDNVLVI